ncbi:MAG: QueT transporter family protein [Ruminococcaceae bacterium]|nr:QueT transporter family protein [Oscillospiraceae bacterium]
MKNSTQKRALALCRASIIAALYVALTYLAMLFGLDKGAIQIRFSEALCILPVFFPEAIGGLYVGCLLANLLTGAAALDIALGPIATLVGALGAYLLGMLMRKKNIKNFFFKCTVPLPTIIANTIIVPFVIYICYTPASEQSLAAIPFFALTVFIGELISAGILGVALLGAIEKKQKYLK